MLERLFGKPARQSRHAKRPRQRPAVAGAGCLATTIRNGEGSLQVGSETLPECLAAWRSPVDHADQLLHWLRMKGLVDGCVLAGDMMLLHQEMCRELGWLPRAWNPIGRALALKMTSGKKITAHINGRRLRVYPLPPAKDHLRDARESRRAHGDSRAAA